jgi:hypothetical protein
MHKAEWCENFEPEIDARSARPTWRANGITMLSRRISMVCIYTNNGMSITFFIGKHIFHLYPNEHSIVFLFTFPSSSFILCMPKLGLKSTIQGDDEGRADKLPPPDGKNSQQQVQQHSSIVVLEAQIIEL